jgi:hypothetical protein
MISTAASRWVTEPSLPLGRLLLEAEVGEGEVAVPVDDESADLALVYLEQVRPVRRQPPEVQFARFAAADAPTEHEDALTVEFAVLGRFDVPLVPGV